MLMDVEMQMVDPSEDIVIVGARISVEVEGDRRRGGFSMKREDGRKLFRAFLGNSRETAGEQKGHDGADGGSVKGEVPVFHGGTPAVPDETAWYLYAWSRDPLEGRFPREQKLAYGFRAAECGRNEAQLILGKTDVWDIAAGMGLKGFNAPRCRGAAGM